MQRNCAFCNHVFNYQEHSIRPATLGGQYFCSPDHATRFFKGEEYVPPQQQQPQLPEPVQTDFFERLGRPKLNVPV